MKPLDCFNPRAFRLWERARRSIWSNDAGSPAVEFALIAPVVLVTLTATFDVGSIIIAKLRLDAQVSAAASFGQLNGSAVDAAGARGFVETAATLVSGRDGKLTATVDLNNAARAVAKSGNVTVTASGDIAECYCPSRSDGKIEWGVKKTCQVSCTDGSKAGRYLQIDASTEHVAMFGGYGLTENGTISVGALVRME